MKIKRISNVLFLVMALMMSLVGTNTSQVEAVTTYSSDPAYLPVRLVGDSINGHSIAYGMWYGKEAGETQNQYYFAIKTTHDSVLMSITGQTGTKIAPFAVLPIHEHLTVTQGGIPVTHFTDLDPVDGLSGNIASSRWSIYRFASLPDNFDGQLVLFVKSEQGGGHDIVDVTHTVQIPVGSFEVTKQWSGGPSIKPSITLTIQSRLNSTNPWSNVSTNDFQTNPVVLESGISVFTYQGLPYADYYGNVIEYRVVESPLNKYETTYSDVVLFSVNPVLYKQTITNTYKPLIVDFSATKEWLVTSNDKKVPVTFQLKRNNVNFGDPVVLDGVIDVPDANGSGELSPWVYTWKNLEGEDSHTFERYNFSVVESLLPGYMTSQDGNVITNMELIDFTATKVFEGDNPNGHPSVTLHLLNDGVIIDSVVLDGSESIPWTHTFENLDSYINGKLANYYVREEVPNNYVVVYNDETNTITNTYNPGTFTITKTWDGPTKPITVYLHQIFKDTGDDTGNDPLIAELDGVVDVEPNAKGSLEFRPWIYVWKNLDLQDMSDPDNPREYGYYVTEAPLGDGYVLDPELSSDIRFHNVYNRTEFTASKEWIGGKDRPSITFELYQDGIIVDSVILDGIIDTPDATGSGELDSWVYTWKNLEKYKTPVENQTYVDAGVHVYTVKEVAVDNYIPTYNEDFTTVTNTYVSPKIDFVVNKTWQGVLEETSAEAVIKLYRWIGDATESYVDEVTLTNDKDTHTFEDLDQYDSNGNLYTYEAREVPIDNYILMSNVTDDYSATFTNAYNRLDFSVEKKWMGVPNYYGDLPSINVFLLRNNETIAIGQLDGEVDDDMLLSGEHAAWVYTFKNLPKFDPETKEAYVYTVMEDTLFDFESQVSDDFLMISNTYQVKDILVEKIWVGGIERPEIQIQLYRGVNEDLSDQVVFLDPVMLDGEMDDSDMSQSHEQEPWKYIFKNVPIVDREGQQYIYTVQEVNIPNYVKDEDDLVITNRFESPLIDIVGTKTWVGGASINPKPSTSIYLLANGEPARYRGTWEDTTFVPGELVDPIVHTLGDDIDFVFTDVPKYDNAGALIEYTLQEEEVLGFDIAQEGKDFTNRFVMEPIDINGTKTWIGGEALNPEAVFTLKADGEDAYHLGEYVDNVYVPGDLVDPVMLGFEDSDIKFTNLPKTTVDGKEIVYTIEEGELEGFEIVQEGNDFTNQFVIEPIDIIGTKTWIGGEEFDPEAVFTLFADGEPARHFGEYVDNVYVPGALVDPIMLGFEDTDIKFTNLPKTTVDGKEIVYTMVEAPLLDYETTQDGFNFTNEFVGEVASDKVFKVEFEKSADKTTFTNLDEVIKYTFTLKNTGELDYVNVEIYDDTLKRVVLTVAVLKPQETITETIEYKVTQADIDRTFITNVATVTGECADCVTPPSPIVDSVTLNYKPELPDTGDSTTVFTIFGSAILLLGFVIISRKRKE